MTNQTKRCVIFYPHIGEYGGIERNIIALATEVRRRGMVPVLLCFYDKIGMGNYDGAMEVIQLGDSPIPWKKARSVRNGLAKVSGGTQGLPLFFGGKAGFYGGLGNPVPYVLHYTDPPSLIGGAAREAGIAGALKRVRSRLSDRVTASGVDRAQVRLTMTRWNAEELRLCYGQSFDVIYQGGLVPSGTLNCAPRCRGKVLRLFSICRISSSKNLDWILDAVAALKKSEIACSFDKVEAVIAGKGPDLERLQKRATELGIEENISFPGFMDPTEVEEAFRQADLFLVPARQGFGLPVLEALYRRVPVVLNRESRISEILEGQPWALVSGDSSSEFSLSVEKHVSQLKARYPSETELASLPSESGWADKIGICCGWW